MKKEEKRVSCELFSPVLKRVQIVQIYIDRQCTYKQNIYYFHPEISNKS
jgi:hypothetical protein